MKYQERCDHQQNRHDHDRRRRMHGREPRQPHRERVFAKTQRPVAEWFRARIHRGTRTRFRPVRSQRDSACEQRGAPTPFGRRSAGGSVSQQRSSGRANHSVNCVPNRIDEWNFVGEKLDHIERDRNPENPRMRQHLQLFRKMNHTETLKQSQRRNRSVQVEARREPSPKRQSERLYRIHAAILLPPNRERAIPSFV